MLLTLLNHGYRLGHHARKGCNHLFHYRIGFFCWAHWAWLAPAVVSYWGCNGNQGCICCTSRISRPSKVAQAIIHGVKVNIIPNLLLLLLPFLIACDEHY